MAPFKLDDTDKNTHPFKVPDGYFEGLNQAILEKTSIENTVPVVSWYRKPAWQMAMASVVVFMVALTVFLQGTDAVGEDFLADISDEEILIYLASNDLSEDEILTHFTFTDDDWVVEEETTLDDIEIDDSMLDDMLLEYELDEDPVRI